MKKLRIAQGLFQLLLLHNLFYGYSGSWSSLTVDGNQWIQVEFGTPFEITAIQTQGRSDYDQWVKSYKLSYGSDGINWNNVNDENGEEMVRQISKTTQRPNNY